MGFTNLFLNNNPKGAVPLALGIAGLSAGGEGEELGALSEELGESINALKHIAKHLREFREFEPTISLREVIQLGQDVAKTGIQTGPRTFEKSVSVGGESVRLKAVLNYAGRLRSVYPLK